jgi:DNA-binding response OmpR family regulator
MERGNQFEVGPPDVNGDGIFGELAILERRLRRVGQAVGRAALVQDGRNPWRMIEDQCAEAAASVASAAALVPEDPLAIEPDRRPLAVRELRLDPGSHRVWFAQEEVALAKLEFELLRALASDPLRVITKTELLKQVWNYQSSPRTRTVDSHASRVRRKLEAAGAPPAEWVINQWGVGYALLRE